MSLYDIIIWHHCKSAFKKDNDRITQSEDGNLQGKACQFSANLQKKMAEAHESPVLNCDLLCPNERTNRPPLKRQKATRPNAPMPDLPAFTHALFASAQLLAAHPGFWLLFVLVFLILVAGLMFLPRIAFVVKTAVGAALAVSALLLPVMVLGILAMQYSLGAQWLGLA